MSLRDRELIIEYIRAVRDHQILLERLSSYIDSANLRLTNVVLAYIMGDREDSPTSSSETVSTTAIRHNMVPRNRRRASFISRPVTIPSTVRRTPAVPPPPPPPPPAPPMPPPPEENTTSATNSPSLSDITVNMDNDPTLSRIRRWADRLSPRVVMHRARSNAVSSPNRELNSDTSFDSSSNIITRPVSTTTVENITNIISRYDAPPGLSTILPNRNRIISGRRPAPRRIPHNSRRYSVMMNIPNIVDDSIPEDLGSPVRVRPQNSQVRNSTELLKWEDISGNYQERCPIDFNEFKEGDDILRIKACSHIFREMNLRAWFRRSPRCPICRYDIRDYDGE